MQSFGEILASQVDVMLLGNCSCIALLSYIHVTMQNRHFRHPWRSFDRFGDKIVGTILHERSEPEG